jgi:hypothetical protein
LANRANGGRVSCKEKRALHRQDYHVTLAPGGQEAVFMRNSKKIISIPGRIQNNKIVPVGSYPTGDEYEIIITFIKKEMPSASGFMRYAGAITEAQAEVLESHLNDCREIDSDAWQ